MWNRLLIIQMMPLLNMLFWPAPTILKTHGDYLIPTMAWTFSLKFLREKEVSISQGKLPTSSYSSTATKKKLMILL